MNKLMSVKFSLMDRIFSYSMIEQEIREHVNGLFEVMNVGANLDNKCSELLSIEELKDDTFKLVILIDNETINTIIANFERKVEGCCDVTFKMTEFKVVETERKLFYLDEFEAREMSNALVKEKLGVGIFSRVVSYVENYLYENGFYKDIKYQYTVEFDNEDRKHSHMLIVIGIDTENGVIKLTYMVDCEAFKVLSYKIEEGEKI